MQLKENNPCQHLLIRCEPQIFLQSLSLSVFTVFCRPSVFAVTSLLLQFLEVTLRCSRTFFTLFFLPEISRTRTSHRLARWWAWRATRRRRRARRPTPPWSRTVSCRLTRPATPCLVAAGGARATGSARRTTRRKKRKRRRMSMLPPAMLAHTGTCTLLTVGTQAASTAPTGTSHRTGCSNAKLSKATTRGTTASAAARGPETPTEREGRPGLSTYTHTPTPQHVSPLAVTASTYR